MKWEEDIKFYLHIKSEVCMKWLSVLAKIWLHDKQLHILRGWVILQWFSNNTQYTHWLELPSWKDIWITVTINCRSRKNQISEYFHFSLVTVIYLRCMMKHGKNQTDCKVSTPHGRIHNQQLNFTKLTINVIT